MKFNSGENLSFALRVEYARCVKIFFFFRQQSFNSQPSFNSRQPSFNSRQQSFNSQRQPSSNLSSRQPSFGSRQQSFNSRQPSCVNSRQPSCNSLHGSRQHSSRQQSFSKQNSLEVETFYEVRFFSLLNFYFRKMFFSFYTVLVPIIYKKKLIPK